MEKANFQPSFGQLRRQYFSQLHYTGFVVQSGNHCRGQEVPSYPAHLSFESLSLPLPPAPGFSIPSKTTSPLPQKKPHWEWENLGAGVESVHGRQTSFGFCTQTNTDDKRNHKLSSWEPKAYFVFFTEEIKNLYTLPRLLQVKHLQDVLKPKTPSGFLQLLVLHLASASLFLYLFLSPTSLTPFLYLLAKPVARRESCIFTLQGDFLAGHILLY